MKKTNYSWEEFLMDASMIANQIKDANLQIKNIYGLPRGGLIFAVLLSHELNLPLIVEKERISASTLVVDDISDTGSQLSNLFTFAEIHNSRPLFSATLWKRNTTQFRPSFYANEMKGENWIDFPWEKSYAQA